MGKMNEEGSKKGVFSVKEQEKLLKGGSRKA